LAEVQLENAPPSSLHSKVVPAVIVETNPNEAELEVVGLLGADVIETVNPVVSTVQEAVPAALVFPALSVAVT
jgi:hypothetical protein